MGHRKSTLLGTRTLGTDDPRLQEIVCWPGLSPRPSEMRTPTTVFTPTNFTYRGSYTFLRPGPTDGSDPRRGLGCLVSVTVLSSRVGEGDFFRTPLPVPGPGVDLSSAPSLLGTTVTHCPPPGSSTPVFLVPGDWSRTPWGPRVACASGILVCSTGILVRSTASGDRSDSGPVVGTREEDTTPPEELRNPVPVSLSSPSFTSPRPSGALPPGAPSTQGPWVRGGVRRARSR